MIYNKIKEILDKLLENEKLSYHNRINKDLLLNLKEHILALYEEFLKQREIMNNLKNHNLVFKNNVYYEVNDAEREPYCPLCWDKENLAIHLLQDPMLPNQYNCPNCRCYYIVSDAIVMGTKKKK